MVYLIDQSKRYAADCSQRFFKYKFRRFVHVHHIFLIIEILIPGRVGVGYRSNSASWWPPHPPSWRPSLAGTRGEWGRYGEGSNRATGLAASSRAAWCSWYDGTSGCGGCSYKLLRPPSGGPRSKPPFPWLHTPRLRILKWNKNKINKMLFLFHAGNLGNLVLEKLLKRLLTGPTKFGSIEERL